VDRRGRHGRPGLRFVAALAAFASAMPLACLLLVDTDGLSSNDGQIGVPARPDATIDDADGSGISDAAIDTSSDPVNCGDRGRDCLGGECVAGRCRPVVLAQGESKPVALFVTDTDVYWVSQGRVD